MWEITFYLVFWFQSARVRNALEASVDTLPLVIAVTVSAAISGFAVTKLGRFKLMVSAGWCLATIGAGLLSAFSPSTSTSQQIGYQILGGWGLGILFPTLNIATQAPQSEKNVGIAAAVFTFIRALGQTFGVAIGGVIFQNQFDQKVRLSNLPPAYLISGQDAERFATELPNLPETYRIVLQYVYSDSLRVVWWVLVPFAGIGFVVSFLARDLGLSRKHETPQMFDELPKSSNLRTSSTVV
jgi:MFS family permease